MFLATLAEYAKKRCTRKRISERGFTMNHTMEIKLYYEDTDCGGVVYYANYLRYMERGRTEYLADYGYSVKKLMDEGTLFMVARAEIDYRSPARYGDTLVLETGIAECSRAVMMFEHRIKEKMSGRTVVEGKIKLVCTDASGRPKRMPREFVEKVK